MVGYFRIVLLPSALLPLTFSIKLLPSFRVRLSERMVLFPFASSQEYTIDYRSDKTIGKCYYKHPHQRRASPIDAVLLWVCVQAGLMNLLL